MEESGIKQNILSGAVWLRALFMLLFAVIAGVLDIVLGVVIIVQFFWMLISRQTNQNLLAFGQSLALYVKAIVLFLTFNTDEKPFPFAAWPTPEEGSLKPKQARKKPSKQTAPESLSAEQD